MRAALLFVLGILLTLAAGEVAFRLLPVSTATRTGYEMHPHLLTYPAGHCFTTATGWDLRNAQKNCANNLGFIADHDFKPDSEAVALIGDSFIEANMLPPQDRLAAQLEKRLGGKSVYAFGGPGSSLLDYAERMKFAASRLGLRTFVVVVTRFDVREALCGSGNIHAVCFDPASQQVRLETQPPPGMLKRIVRESALAQYLFSQLKVNVGSLAKNLGRKADSGPVQRSTSDSAPALQSVVKLFFAEIAKIEGGRFYFVLEPPLPGATPPRPQLTESDLFRAGAMAAQARIIDASRRFAEFSATTHLHLEVGPYDKHWNRAAVALIADAIVEALTVAPATREDGH